MAWIFALSSLAIVRGRSRCNRRRSRIPKLTLLEDRSVPALVASTDGSTVFDTNTNMNWLANANLAADPKMHFGVKGINKDGSMTWTQARKWVYELNQHDYLGHTDWTLPGNFAGAGFGQATSDMGELFYSEFGGAAGESVTDILASNTQLNSLFQKFQPYLYWDNDNVLPGGAAFSFGNGFQTTVKFIDVSYVIPEYPENPPPKPAKDPGAYHPMPKGSVVANPSLAQVDNGQIVHDANLNIYWLA